MCICVCQMIERVVSALMLQSCPLSIVHSHCAIKLSTLQCNQTENTAFHYLKLYCCSTAEIAETVQCLDRCSFWFHNSGLILSPPTAIETAL